MVGVALKAALSPSPRPLIWGAHSSAPPLSRSQGLSSPLSAWAPPPGLPSPPRSLRQRPQGSGPPGPAHTHCLILSDPPAHTPFHAPWAGSSQRHTALKPPPRSGGQARTQLLCALVRPSAPSLFCLSHKPKARALKGDAPRVTATAQGTPGALRGPQPPRPGCLALLGGSVLGGGEQPHLTPANFLQKQLTVHPRTGRVGCCTSEESRVPPVAAPPAPRVSGRHPLSPRGVA